VRLPYLGHFEAISYQIWTEDSYDIGFQIDQSGKNRGARATEIWQSRDEDITQVITSVYLSR